MSKSLLPDWETRRIFALHELEILDSPAERDFDGIVALAAQICNFPVAMLGFVDEHRTWYKACLGIELKNTLTHQPYQFENIIDAKAIQIEDTLLDERSADHFLVTTAPYFRAVTILPLVTGEGLVLGHLTVANYKTGLLTPAQLAGMEMLVQQAMSLLKLRLKIIKMRDLQLAKELDKQKNFYENILNKIPTDIAVFDTDHRYLFVNPYAIKNEELRKYIIGKDDFEYARYRKRDDAGAIKRRAQFLKAKITGKSVSWEDQAKNPEGEVITHFRRLYPVHDEDGNVNLVIGIGVDITERKYLEQEQDVLVEQLSFQNTQLFDFCNIVTHNLRGPLNNMSLLVEFVEDSKDEEEQKELVSKLKPVIDGLNLTFNELVETILIQQDLEIKSEKVNLQEVLIKTLEGLDMEVKKARASVSMDFNHIKTICFPPKYVDSIFHNLISNALKYRSPKRDLLVKVTAHRKGTSIVLSVEDNGLGLDLNKYRDNVFKIGKVFHSHPNAKGLGLYMTKTQVEVMGGTIDVESEVDKGAKFTIEFKGQ